jgi:ectoine hydroxylase-related dioxygenase (phytanoyl-CoA dioxygenase family)
MNHLDQIPSVSEDVILDFRTKGHALTEQLLPAGDVPFWRAAISEAAYKNNRETRKMEERDTYGKAFLQIMNLWEVDERVRAFVLARRFAGVAAQLLGVDNVRLYHDQALYKEAGGGLTPWHQDQYYWPLSTTKTVTMWMPLVDIDQDMGMLTFASGSQLDGRIGNIAISDESEEMLETHINGKGYAIHRAKQMRAGDATWHYGWTLHSAPGNLSHATREVMTIIYFADGATVTEPINTHQENDRQRWLRGVEPGKFATSDLNPLLL